MDAKARILAIRLMETIQKDPRYAKSLGIEAALKRKNPLHTEGLTDV